MKAMKAMKAKAMKKAMNEPRGSAAAPGAMKVVKRNWMTKAMKASPVFVAASGGDHRWQGEFDEEGNDCVACSC